MTTTEALSRAYAGDRPQRVARLPRPIRQVGVYMALGKARLVSLVLITTVVGYILSVPDEIAWATLLWALAGTALTAGGANGLNQWYETGNDARMRRTQDRPIVAGRISGAHALIASAAAVAAGVVLLAVTVNGLTAALGGAAAAIYVLIYTPLKQHSSACTLAGAAVGAIPPLMGTAAAGGGDAGLLTSIGTTGWLLGALLFAWQIPHSLALAWLYREDYARGGFRLLVWGDAGGGRTFHMILLYCLALIAVSLALVPAGPAGVGYGLGAVALGAGLLVAAVRLHQTASDVWARRLFLATVIYLPLLLGLLIVG